MVIPPLIDIALNDESINRYYPVCKNTKTIDAPRSIDFRQCACALEMLTRAVTSTKHSGGGLVQSQQCSLFFFFCRDRLGPVPCCHSELCILQTVGRTPWTGDQPIVRPLRIQHNTNTDGSRTFISRVGFEPTNPGFDRAKAFLVLDQAATLIAVLTIVVTFCNFSNKISGIMDPTLKSKANAKISVAMRSIANGRLIHGTC
jgi:hypothetical protein